MSVSLKLAFECCMLYNSSDTRYRDKLCLHLVKLLGFNNMPWGEAEKMKMDYRKRLLHSLLFSCCNIYVVEDLSQALISNSQEDRKQHCIWFDKSPLWLTLSDLRQINMWINVFGSNKSVLRSTDAEICLAESLNKIWYLELHWIFYRELCSWDG